MDKEEKEIFKKGFNQGYILNSIPSGGKVVEQLLDIAKKNDPKSIYGKGFNSGIKHGQMEKTIGKSITKFKKPPTRKIIRSSSKKPPSRDR